MELEIEILDWVKLKSYVVVDVSFAMRERLTHRNRHLFLATLVSM